MTGVFYVDLDEKKIMVVEYSKEDLKEDLEYFKVKDPVELSDYDRRVFKSEREANNFVRDYNYYLERLPKMFRAPFYPCLIYKRRYLVLTAMGIKMQTKRTYSKNWKPGQLINLYDQTFFVTVKITSVQFDEAQGLKGLFIYNFELV